jgi:hypothetical protein
VNQMRFFSSSAFAKAPKFRLAASCSAADAMDVPLKGGKAATLAPRHRPALDRLSNNRPPS